MRALILILVLGLSAPTWALTCGADMLTAGSTAAGSMVSGYVGYKQYFVRVSAVEKLNEVLLYDLRVEPRINQRGFTAGDKYVITYSRGRQLVELQGQAQSALDELQRLLRERDLTLHDLDEALNHGHITAVAQSRVVLTKLETDIKAARALRQTLVHRLDQLHPEAPVRLALSNSNRAAVVDRIRALRAEGMSVFSVHRIPKEVLGKIARAGVRSAAIPLAMVVALGLVSAENLASARLSCLRSDELDRVVAP